MRNLFVLANTTNIIFMRKITFILVIVFLSKFVSAQLFENEFTVKSTIFTETDTIECFLPYGDSFDTYIINYKISKEDKNRDKKSINIKHIVKIEKSYDTFDKVIYNNQSYMMKLLVDGPVKLYEYYIETQGTTTMSTNGTFNSTIPYDKTIYYIQKDDVLYKIKGNKKKKLKKILTGYSEVDEMIDDLNNSLLRYNLTKVVNKYNYLNNKWTMYNIAS